LDGGIGLSKYDMIFGMSITEKAAKVKEGIEISRLIIVSST